MRSRPELSGALVGDRYEIQDSLGRGGMGTVYLATDRQTGQSVAVKELRVPEWEDYAAAARQFHREGEILASLSHPGLVPVLDFVTWHDGLYLVMGVASGRSLGDLLMEGKVWGFPAVMDVIRQICDILEYLHQRTPPVILRDLKPANIIVDSDGKVTVIDFGLARMLHSGSRTTRFARNMGSPGYAAIEQYGDGTTDERTDLYALAATLYAMLTGVAPPAALDRFAGQIVRPASESNKTVTAELDLILEQGLALAPQDRFQRVRAFRHALEQASAAVKPTGTMPIHLAVPAPPTHWQEAEGCSAYEALLENSRLPGRERAVENLRLLAEARLTTPDWCFAAQRKNQLACSALFAALVEGPGLRLFALNYDTEDTKSVIRLLKDAMYALRAAGVRFIDYVWQEGQDDPTTDELLERLGFKPIQERYHLYLPGEHAPGEKVTTRWRLMPMEHIGEGRFLEAMHRAMETTRDRRIQWGLARWGREVVIESILLQSKRLGYVPHWWHGVGWGTQIPAGLHIGVRIGNDAHMRMLDTFDVRQPPLVDLIRDVVTSYMPMRPSLVWSYRDCVEVDMLTALHNNGFQQLGSSIVLVCEL